MENKLVSREDCYKVIQKCVSSENFEIVNFKVKSFEDKDREYYKSDSILEVSAQIQKNISRFRFFLKQFKTKYDALNEYHHSINLCDHEIFFYEKFLPTLSDTLQDYEIDIAPKCLLAKANEIIILEDLSLRSYVAAKKMNPLNLDRFHICLALKNLAKLHAGSLAYEELQLKGAKVIDEFKEEKQLLQEAVWQHDADDGIPSRKMLVSGIRGIKTLLAQLQQLEKLEESLSSKIDDLLERCLEILKPQEKFRNVICHGDLHTKNMLFKYEGVSPTECVFINFGLCQYFLPAYDVLSLIFSSTSKLFRQHYFTYLIQYYHKCLNNELMKQELVADQILSFEELQQSINFLMPFIKLKTVLFLQEHGAKKGFYKIIQRDDNEYRHFLYEDKSDFVLDVIGKDRIFKVMMVEALEELLDTLNVTSISKENCYEILEKRLETTVYDLREFYVNPVSDDKSRLELTMTVCVDDKDEVLDEYKYLIENNEDYLFKILSQIQ